MMESFDKVWHGGVIFKLRCNGIAGSLLDFFQNYLSNRYQRVFLNGQESKLLPLKAGVPQGSVFFLIYINDLTDNISSGMCRFADDSSLFACVTEVTKRTTNWLRTWRR